MRPFNLALLQMRVVPGEKRENLAHASELIDEACAEGGELLVLPEVFDLGWTHSSARREGGNEVPKLFQRKARQYNVHIAGGYTERDGKITYNSAVLVDPKGTILLKHRKLNELAIGHRCYAQGDRLGVAHTKLGAVGLMICADAFAPGQVISRALCYMGADIIISPSAWAVPANHDNIKEPYGQLWLDNYRPVARDFKVWIAGVSNVGPITAGPWKGRRCIGSSLLIGPDGSEALRGPYGEEAILRHKVQLVGRPARGDEWGKLLK